MRVRPTIALLALAGLNLAFFGPFHVFHVEELAAHDHKVLLGEFSQVLPDEPIGPAECIDGLAMELFPCEGVDLLSFFPTSAMSTARGGDLRATLGQGGKIEVSDVWGWTSAATGSDYALVGKTNGAAFFRIDDPTAPEYHGDLPNPSPARAIWHDIKVDGDTAVIVSESEVHGMQIFDLTRLDGATGVQEWEADGTYLLESFSAHNVAVNAEADMAYLVGGALAADPEGLVCGSGLHMVDISDPAAPSYAGCYSDDGYVHDTQCVRYDGPDTDHVGKDICVNSSETEMSVVDVSDPANPVLLDKAVYDQPDYTHQGWFTEDGRWFLLGDEGDETGGVTEDELTRTIIFDLADLDDVPDGTAFHGTTTAIDHNMYTLDGLLYQSNYAAGLRILDTAGLYDETVPLESSLEEIAYFDVFPDHDDAKFVGTWSNYPYFGNGLVVVSAYDGLFLLQVDEATLAHRFDPRTR